ncbi:MAG TPA: MarR family transcriptional regulator [Treponema sp.]|nr:MAG: hypothetical protein A2Y36_13885 [Treponema sp. GWA1_62_8]OHE68522.1 MAG: hypothetical protein A2413_04885 [Treponema sp. RIFOXYC1_FULL_61_9]OHE70184.1 MAG: hypothetical protein A2001_06875 [Treponema sp. GWC1_61_84]HCM28435.1 MarR family transcriptional regulator [Treponema sp.]
MDNKTKEEFNEQLRVMSTQAVLRSRAVADRLGINPTDLETLEILMREGKSTAGTLAKSTGLTTGAVTGVIDRLSRSGFAARESDPDDRRKILVALNGKKVMEEIAPLFRSIADAVDELLDGYPDEELVSILGFLKKINALSREDLDRLAPR